MHPFLYYVHGHLLLILNVVSVLKLGVFGTVLGIERHWAFTHQVYPGEIVELSPEGVRSLDIVPRPKISKPVTVAHEDPNLTDHVDILQAPPPAFCIFEYVYFARADSMFEGMYGGSTCVLII